MAIEFRCATCNRLLRVGDDAAGKHAKCPECGTVLIVPTIGSPAGPPPPQAPLPGGAENPYSSPAVGYYTPPPAPTGEIRHTQLDINDVFSRTWTIFKRQWGACVLALLGVMVLNFVVTLVVRGGCSVVGFAAQDRVLAELLNFLGALVTTAFNIWLQIGQTIFYLKIGRGQNATASDIFSGGPYFLRILGGSVLFGLIVMVGFLMLIIPGIIFSLMFFLFYYLIIDRNVGVMDSLNLSKDLMSGNKLTVFVLGVLASLLVVAITLLTCGIGFFLAAPYGALLYVVAYLIITGQPTADRFEPPYAG